jgi:ATP-binding cassette subfamily A (ABC1) protein 3
MIKYILKGLKIEKYKTRQAGHLSGGNKRKLCFAIALISAPKILFLDEPSTGLDPVSRFHLWKMLKSIIELRKTSTVLTTHTMSEAEQLCDKIGIMINGQFRCFGSLS